MDIRLENKDYVVTLDKSGSMNENVSPGFTRWQQGQEYITTIAQFANQYDPDGIKVIVFSGRHKVYDNVTEEKVKEVFAKETPMGSTNLSAALQVAFSSYNQRKKKGETNNGEINIVLTDGEPNNRLEVMKVIARFTHELDSEDEYGISFIQVGNDKSAREFLKVLDDRLEEAGAKFDIVNTITCDEIDNLGLSVENILVKALDE